MDLAIIPECYLDTNLVETLVPPKSQYNHQKACGTVTKVMKEKFVDRFAVGIIDKDKREVDYLAEFNIIGRSTGLILHKHKIKHHYIIQIVPAIERFIWKCVEEVGISIADFQLPVDLELFKLESKTVNSKNDDRFKRLFNALKYAGSQEMVRLSEIITYLNESSYKAEESKLEELLK